jgi:hypothetical protein
LAAYPKKERKKKEEPDCILALMGGQQRDLGSKPGEGIDTAWFSLNFPVGRNPVTRFLRWDPEEDPFTFAASFYKKKFCVIQIDIFVFYVYNI